MWNTPPPSSAGYRDSSNREYVQQQTIMSTLEPEATLFSATHNVSMDEAYSQLSRDYDRWRAVRLEGYDSHVGDRFQSKNITIVCNSLLREGLYNDTIGIYLDNEMRSVATYKNRKTEWMQHSGDKATEYGLEHIIELTETAEHRFQRGYVVSAPWRSSRPLPVRVLADTNPVLEIRTEDDGVLRRFVIPQDMTLGGDRTACVNAQIQREGYLWTVEIRRDYIMGFADDPELLCQETARI